MKSMIYVAIIVTYLVQQLHGMAINPFSPAGHDLHVGNGFNTISDPSFGHGNPQPKHASSSSGHFGNLIDSMLSSVMNPFGGYASPGFNLKSSLKNSATMGNSFKPASALGFGSAVGTPHSMKHKDFPKSTVGNQETGIGHGSSSWKSGKSIWSLLGLEDIFKGKDYKTEKWGDKKNGGERRLTTKHDTNGKSVHVHTISWGNGRKNQPPLKLSFPSLFGGKHGQPLGDRKENKIMNDWDKNYIAKDKNRMNTMPGSENDKDRPFDDSFDEWDNESLLKSIMGIWKDTPGFHQYKDRYESLGQMNETERKTLFHDFWKWLKPKLTHMCTGSWLNTMKDILQMKQATQLSESLMGNGEDIWREIKATTHSTTEMQDEVLLAVSALVKKADMLCDTNSHNAFAEMLFICTDEGKEKFKEMTKMAIDVRTDTEDRNRDTIFGYSDNVDNIHIVHEQ